jgi:heme-degrading monooxygenase HmoA
MLFKLIVAIVPDDLRAKFAPGQAAWAGLGSGAGFLAQAGGWEREDPSSAVVIAYWKNEQFYADFMAQQHDSLADHQGETYSALHVSSGHVITTVNETDPRIALAEAEIVRITDCTLLPNCSPTFLASQFEVWNPALATAGGMLLGTVSRLGRSPDRFGVATFWRTSDALRNYQETLYPGLRLQANLDEHIDKLTAYHARLEPAWKVFGSRFGTN